MVITDPGKDPDDEMALVLGRSLTDLGLIRFEAVIAVLKPSTARAQLAKGTLEQLGLDVPVGIGSEIVGEDMVRSAREFDGIPYLAGASRLENGTKLLRTVLERADDRSLVWLLIAGMTDAADLLRNHETQFRTKTSRVVLMGGVQQVDNEICLDESGYMVPDSAQNNEFDRDAAAFLYVRLQELGIPMTVVTREAAYAMRVPRSFYDELATTTHPVGIKLRNSQRKLIEALWRRANYPADDFRRERLPDRCDRRWFCETFCDGAGGDRTGEDEVWDLVLGFNLYDPLACLASIESLRERFFHPERVTIRGVTHQIIGVSQTKSGVSDRAGLLSFLTQNLRSGLERSRDAHQAVSE